MAACSCCHKRHSCEDPKANVVLTINLCEDEYQTFSRSDAPSRSVFIRIEGESQNLEHTLTTSDNIISVTFESEPGRYSVYVWAEECGKCRNMSALPYITLNDALSYSQTCDAQGGAMLLQAVGRNQKVSMTLQRPLAKIRLVSEDATGKDLTGLSATVSYTGFFPTMFNVNSFLPCDAATGYSFTNPIESEIIGEDFIFADNDETFVNVNITIRNQSGEIVANTTNIKIPYKRGHVTTVTGKFLTNQSSGNSGINIDTEWSGEYEVEF